MALTPVQAVGWPLLFVYMVVGGQLLGAPLFRAYRRPGKRRWGVIPVYDLFRPSMFEPEGQRYRWPYILYQLGAVLFAIFVLS